MKYKYMPLLDSIKASLKKSSFRETVIIASQHILYSNYVMFNYLFNLGFNPEKLFIIGKSYSTDQEVSKKFIKKGVYVHSYGYSSFQAFDKQYKLAVDDFLRTIKKKSNFNNAKKIIVIDDGGFLITAIHKEKWLDTQKIVAIEQTSSGYDKIKSMKLEFPVINVARSW